MVQEGELWKRSERVYDPFLVDHRGCSLESAGHPNPLFGSIQAESQRHGSTRIVSFTSTYVLTIYANVGHLSPSDLNDDGSDAGLDTVCTFSYSSRFRKLS